VTVDPELYLRRCGENDLIRPPNTFSALGDIAAAFVAVGALEFEVARRVVHDYAWAANVRSGVSRRSRVSSGRKTVTPPAHVVRPDATVLRVEEITPEDPATRFLFHELATPRMRFMREESPVAIDALVAIGALSPDNPQLEHVRAVARIVGSRMPVRMGVAPSSGPVGDLPEPWRSVLGRRTGRAVGRTGTVTVAVTTPPIDGRIAEIRELISHGDHFELDVGLTGWEPAYDLHRHHEGLEWWLTDDLGNRWLGENGHRGGGSITLYNCSIEFSPGLDPKATKLELALMGLTQRCVIPIDLAWET
jgi:hypothetical protein